MKDIYLLKKVNETRFVKIYAGNWLERFKTKSIENSLTKQSEIYKMLNIALENSIDAIKKSNIVNKNIRVNDEIRNEIVQDTAENSNADNQIFENIITNNNLSNSKF